MKWPAALETIWTGIRAPQPHPLTEALFIRLLGLVYLSSFASFWPQMEGLFGRRGVVPVVPFLQVLSADLGKPGYYKVPTLFWLNATDGALVGCCVAGCLASLLLIAGVASRAAAIACWVFYLSIVSVGVPFTNFQWDAILLEAGFLAFFAGASWLVWAYRFLLFRLIFESGAVKLLSGDLNWRNYHALRFHFMTQPLPNPLAYYAYRLPDRLLDFMTAATLVIELFAPFLLFAPRRIRQVAVGLLMVLQLIIILTGNYAFFNLLTLALCLWGLDDRTFAAIAGPLRRTFSARLNISQRAAVVLQTSANGVLAVTMLLGAGQVIAMFSPPAVALFRPVYVAIAPYAIVNTYGLFATMTTTRPELIIEGSDDQVTWREYGFRYKPGELHRGLPQIAPYQPRLDWQMWFAALGDIQGNRWVGNILYRILTNEPSVVGLLEPSPFSPAPRYVRVLMYDYSFTTPAERARTGAVWQRQLRGTWFGPVSLTGR